MIKTEIEPTTKHPRYYDALSLCLCVTICTAGERATTLTGAYSPYLKIQKQYALPKRQGTICFHSFSLNNGKHVDEFYLLKWSGKDPKSECVRSCNRNLSDMNVPICNLETKFKLVE